MAVSSRIALVSMAALALGCGSANEQVGETEAQGRLWEPAADGAHDYRVVPPAREIVQFKKANDQRIIYLNRNGGTYVPGWDDSSSNRSSIIDRTAKIPAYRGNAQAWAELRTCVEKEFARWNVTVTDVDPGRVPHVEAVIGGMPGAIGLGNDFDGMAPMSSNGAVIERAVVYVFAENTPNAHYACQVATHEIGHAYGLEHEYLCADPMTYLEGCGHKTFQDKAAACGTHSPVKCRNGGKQNTVLHLNDVLGLAKAETVEEDAPPEVALVSPSNAATFEPRSTITIRANVTSSANLASVVLRWEKDGTTTDVDCDAPIAGTTCSHSNAAYTWTVKAGTGTRTWSIKAVDVAGNATTSAKRVLTLDAESTPPPTDDDVIDLVSPKPSTIALRGADLPVVVEGKYLAVFVIWSGPTGAVVRKLERDGDDGAWKTKLRISSDASPGARTLQVMAVDAQGKTMTGAPRTVVVQ